MLLYFIRKWLRKQIAQGHIEDVMYELVEASKEVWYEDNAPTVCAHLRNEVSNAVAYSYQCLNVSVPSQSELARQSWESSPRAGELFHQMLDESGIYEGKNHANRD